jgi:hypothetical protein
VELWGTDSGGSYRPDILTQASTVLLIPAITPPTPTPWHTLGHPGAQREKSLAMETSQLLLLLILLSVWTGADSLKLRKYCNIVVSGAIWLVLSTFRRIAPPSLLTASLVAVFITTEHIASTCDSLHSYTTGGAGFESRPGHKLSSLRYVCDDVLLPR